MIQSTPRVHSRTIIIGLIVTLIIFISSIHCGPISGLSTFSRSGRSKSEIGNDFDKPTRSIRIKMAPPQERKEIKNETAPTVNQHDLKVNASNDDKPLEIGIERRDTKQTEPPESDNSPKLTSHVGSDFIPSIFQEMEQYEIRINPVVRQYNESAYKVALLATLVRKSGGEPPRELPTVEGTDLDSLFETVIRDIKIENQTEKIERPDLYRNISESSRPIEDNPVISSPSIPINSLPDALAIVTDGKNTSVNTPSEINSLNTSPTPPAIPVIERAVTKVTTSSSTTSSTESVTVSSIESNSTKSEREKKTEPIGSVTKVPSICDRKVETVNPSLKPMAETSSVKPSATTVAPTLQNLTPSVIDERANASSSASSIATILISSTTEKPQPINKLNSTRESDTSIVKVDEPISLNIEDAKPAPETEWKPEGPRAGPHYLMEPNNRYNYVTIGASDRGARNDQVKPIRAANPPITRQNEKPQYQGNQRQVNVPPSVISYNVPPPPPPPPPPSPFTTGRLNYNQESNNVVGTRQYNQYPAWNPAVNTNNGQYQNQRQNSDQRGIRYEQQPRYRSGQPIAIEEIVHSKGPMNQNRIQPELFMKIIRHYFVNAWPREEHYIFERKESNKNPQSRSLTVNNRNRYQT